jgi:predicted lactoylglutathione lyase
MNASLDFYREFAGMHVVHRRRRHQTEVVWISDQRRPFVVVLMEATTIEGRLSGTAHLGIGCESRERVDELCRAAARQGCLSLGPQDAGPPVGYSALLQDPDGHNLELSFGQEIGVAIESATSAANASPSVFTATTP